MPGSGQRGKNVPELFRIGHAVIGRQTYANQQYARIRFLDMPDHRAEIGLHEAQRKAAQAVVCAQFKNHDCGFVLRQRKGQACQAAGAGFAANAGIDHLPVLFVIVEALLQQAGPGLAGLETVARRQTVTEHQNDWRSLHGAGYDKT